MKVLLLALLLLISCGKKEEEKPDTCYKSNILYAYEAPNVKLINAAKALGLSCETGLVEDAHSYIQEKDGQTTFIVDRYDAEHSPIDELKRMIASLTPAKRKKTVTTRRTPAPTAFSCSEGYAPRGARYCCVVATHYGIKCHSPRTPQYHSCGAGYKPRTWYPPCR